MIIIPGASAKFLHLHFQKRHISPPETKLQQLKNWRENDIIYCAWEKIVYIDIGYKPASTINYKWRKETEDKEATLM